MSEIHVTSKAQANLAEIVTYLLDKNAELASRLMDAVDDAYVLIAENPRQFARLETCKADREIRRLLLRDVSYLVIYEMLDNEPWVHAIQHTSRAPDAWLRR